MALTLPVDGQTNWGDELNAAITQADNDALAAQSSINNHAANSPADPHGDRAFAQSLITPLTSGVNLPNGYVKLGSDGHLPAGVIAGGLFTNIYDIVASFGAVGNGSTDTTLQIQAALDAANSAGGGVVWVPDGIYAISIPLLIGSNTWLQLSPGATIRRIAGASTPFWMVTNFASSNTSLQSPNTGPIIVTGGTFDSVGAAGLTAQCTPLMFIHGTRTVIRDTRIFNVANNPAIELNGCQNTYMDNLILTGSTTAAPTVPAIRLNTTAAAITPAGLPGGTYDNANTQNVYLKNSGILGSGSGPWPYGSLIGTDLTTGGQSIFFVNIMNCRCPDTNLAPIVPANWSQLNATFNRFDGFTDQGLYTDTGTDLYIAALNSSGVPTSTNAYIDGVLGFASGGSSSAEPVPEGWHSLGSLTGATVNIARYRMMPDGMVQMQIDVTFGGNTAVPITFSNTIPLAYRPLASDVDVRQPMAQTNGAGGIARIFVGQASGAAPGQVQLAALSNVIGTYSVSFQYPVI